MSNVSLRHELFITIVDKLLIALILLATGTWDSEHLETFKSRQVRQQEIMTA